MHLPSISKLLPNSLFGQKLLLTCMFSPCRKSSGPHSIPVPAPEHEHLPHPLTPDIYQICSKRSFDGQVCLVHCRPRRPTRAAANTLLTCTVAEE